MIWLRDSHSLRSREAGSTIVLSMLALVIIALLMLFVATMTMGSLTTQRKKAERSVGMAAGDSAIEQYRSALQMYLAADHNGYQLDGPSLTQLAQRAGATVLPNAQTSERWNMAPVLVPPQYRHTVREETENSYGYWQIYNVIPPRRTATRANDLIVYFRAWGTTRSAGSGASITTKPRIFRVEYRPTYMSDYQAVSDEPFFVSNETMIPWIVSAPVHSNGYKGPEWMTADIAGIEIRRPVICQGRGRFSTSQTGNTSMVNALFSAAGCDIVRDGTDVTAKKVSLLGAEETFRVLREKCSSGGGAYVRCHTMPPAIPATPTTPAQHVVVLAGNSVIIDGMPYTPTRLPDDPQGDSARIAIHMTGDVRVTGMLSGPAGVATGVTIATERAAATDPSPTVYLGPAAVGVSDPAKDSVGIISGGDVILGLDQPMACVPIVRGVAAIAQSGSVTISRDLVTVSAPAVEPMTRQCPMPIMLDGSFASHGTIVTNKSWNEPAGAWVGYATTFFQYSGGLYHNPPPYFTTVSPWGVMKAKDADTRCLTAAKAGDETCE